MNLRGLPAGIVVVAGSALLASAPGTTARAAGQPGASIPWTTYEAEDATTNGTVLGPAYTGRSPEREASGRKCVRLSSTGQHVEFTANADANGIVVRYSIPDSTDGVGVDATLTLYINGKAHSKLPLTSRFSYLYGDYPYTNKPSDGSPRNFWDEARVLVGAIHAGDVIRLQRDAADTAAEYRIDFVDLEPVPAPLARPANSLAITDFGAKPNDDADDRPAIAEAVRAAKEQRKSVWMPPGRYVVKGSVDVSDVTVQGAGMWHTTLVGVDDYKPESRVAFYGAGSNVTLSDFAIIGKLNYRNDSEPNDAIGNSFGTGSVIRNLWIEHTKVGAWVINSDRLLVEGCRFRNTIADGINLCIGIRNSIVTECTARGTGDDCFAMWPAVYAKSDGRHASNRFVHCTGQLPFLAQAFSIYGGEANTVEDCVATDIPYGAGLFASTTFPTEFGFAGTTTYRRVRLTRAGDADGAIGVVANLVDLAGLRFEDVEVIDSPTDGIKFISVKDKALRGATFDRVRIVRAGVSGRGAGIVEAKGAIGTATVTDVSVANANSGGCQDDAPAFQLVRGAGNSGLDNEGRQSKADLPAARRASVAP